MTPDDDTLAIEQLAAHIVKAADEILDDEWATAGMEPTYALPVLAALADAKDALQAIYKQLEVHLWDLLAADDQTDLQVAGCAVTRRGNAPRYAWDKEALTSRVFMAALEDRHVDVETGEAESKEEAVFRGMVDAFALHTKGAPVRSGWLKAHGVDPDDYQNVDWEQPRSAKSLQWNARPNRNGEDQRG